MRSMRCAWITDCFFFLFRFNCTRLDRGRTRRARSGLFSRTLFLLYDGHYPWQFMVDCKAQDCFNTNPDSPYGMPCFGTNTPFQHGHGQAVRAKQEHLC